METAKYHTGGIAKRVALLRQSFLGKGPMFPAVGRLVAPRFIRSLTGLSLLLRHDPYHCELAAPHFRNLSPNDTLLNLSPKPIWRPTSASPDRFWIRVKREVRLAVLVLRRQ